jgi:hypothetical protein
MACINVRLGSFACDALLLLPVDRLAGELVLEAPELRMPSMLSISFEVEET